MLGFWDKLFIVVGMARMPSLELQYCEFYALRRQGEKSNLG
jgi:hypothetical protein